MENGAGPFRWVGPLLCFLLVLGAAARDRGLLGAGTEVAVTLAVVLVGVFLALRGPEKRRRLAELYLWLAFILSLNHLQLLSSGLAGRTGFEELDVLRGAAVLHLVLVVLALRELETWSREASRNAVRPLPARLAAGLFVVGAVVFWVGARTFPGMSLEEVHTHRSGHVWTSVNFLIATVLTLAGLTLFTLALREAGDRYLALPGLLVFSIGSVLWILHLAFRLTVQVQAAEIWSRTSAPPTWYEPWRELAALLFFLYTVLAYLGLAAYGGALLRTGWVPRWACWLFVFFGLLAAPLGGLPLFIHVLPWLAGILMLRRVRGTG